MQLNFDTIRKVLLYIERVTRYVESEEQLQPMIVPLSQLVGENKCGSLAEALYIVRKLEEGGYIITNETGLSPVEKLFECQNSEKPSLCVLDITFQGIEFLNLIRDDEVWDSYKSNNFIMSFEVIKQFIPKLATNFNI